MKAVLLGTTNPSKLKRMGDLWTEAGGAWTSPVQLGCSIEAAEDAHTAVDNAVQKALAWHRASGLPVLTEDSGLVLVDLPRNHPDQPGVRVRRANGHSMNDDEMLAYYQAMIHRHGGQLRAAWQDAWCLLLDEEHILTYADDDECLARHACVMVEKPCAARHPGWPLDSLTLYPGLGSKYKAELSAADMQDVKWYGEDLKRLIQWMRRNAKQMEAQVK